MSKNILLLENDAFYVEIFGTLVHLFLQHEFNAARSEDEAFARLRDRLPDLILVDFDIGRQAAMEFTEKLRDDATTKRIPIIAICHDDDTRDVALGAGCSAFLAKPFKVRDMEALIARLLADA